MAKSTMRLINQSRAQVGVFESISEQGFRIPICWAFRVYKNEHFLHGDHAVG